MEHNYGKTTAAEECCTRSDRRASGEVRQIARKKKFRESIDLLHEALALIPSPAPNYTEYQWLWFRIAEAYTSMESFEDALAAYEKLAQCPGVLELPMYHVGRAQCLRALGRSAESLIAFCDAKRLLNASGWKQFFKELGKEESIDLVEQRVDT